MNAPADPIPTEVQRSEVAKKAYELSSQVIAQAERVTVSSPDEYLGAVELCRSIAASLKVLDEEQTKITKPLHTAWKNALNFFQRLREPRELADAIIRMKLKSYDIAQERIASEARRAAEAKAEAERKAAQAKIDEEKAKAEAKARQEREAADAARREQERLQREADEAKSRGDRQAAQKAAQEAADAAAARARKADAAALKTEQRAEAKVDGMLERQASIVAPVIIAEKTAVKGGLARRTVKKWKVVDPDKVKRMFMVNDVAKITKQVNALGKDAEDIVGGIYVWEEADLTIKAAK